jgi:probable HAF family extracellular repeat protein
MAYVWTNGVYTPPAGVDDGNGPLGINDLGHLAGSGNLRGFIYRNGQSTDLGQLEPVFNSYTFAQGINNSDMVVGDAYRPSILHYHAFTWSNGVISDLTPNAPVGTNAAAINNVGTIVGQYDVTAARWDPQGHLTVLTTPQGYVQSEAVAVNGNGFAVGSSHASYFFNEIATVWSPFGTAGTTLPLLNSYPVSDAAAINNLGQVIGTAGYAGEVFAPVLWQNGVAKDLNTLIDPTSGWALGTPKAINDAGEIVGAGTLHGVGHAYLLMPVPEPAACGVAAVLGACSLIRRRGRQAARTESAAMA